MPNVHLLTPPLKWSKEDFYIFHLPFFYYNPPFCPPNPLLINHILIWKSKVKHTGVDITCFFQDAKSSLAKHKSVFWKRLMEPVKHLSWRLLQKKLTAYSQNNFRKKSTLDVWEGPKEYQLLLWWTPPQILTPPLNLKIWCRIPALSLITHSPHPTVKLPRIQILEEASENYPFCWNSGNDANGREWEEGGHLVCVIMTHCIRKSICDLSLM